MADEGVTGSSNSEYTATASNKSKEMPPAAKSPEDKTLLGKFLVHGNLGGKIHSPPFKLILVSLIPLLAFWFLSWLGLFIALIIIFLFFRNLLGGKIIPVVVIVIIAIIALIMMEPILQYWLSGSGNIFPLRGATFGTKTKKEVGEANVGISQFIRQTQINLQRQIQCAQGMCPEGETEGPQIGMMLSSPQLLYQNKPIIGGNMYFSSVIQGYNLEVYPDIIVYPSCSINNVHADVVPKRIPFTDISNYQAVVRCSGIVQPDTYFTNTLNVSLDFNFTTESDLRMFIMDDKTRNSLMMNFGNDFMSELFGIQGDPVAKYNDGPINLGMRITQYPIAVRSDESAALVFALTNQWKGLNGKLINITSMKIIVPEGIEILPEEAICPFKRVDSTTYTLNDDFKIDEPMSGILNFFCGIKVNTKKTDFPVWIPHLKVVTSYNYRMTSHKDIYVYKNIENNGGGQSSGSQSSSGKYNPAGCNVKNPIQFIWPVSNPEVTSPFGPRTDPLNKDREEFHRGIDIVSTSGDTSILAAASGTVVAIKDNCVANNNCNGFGNYVKVDYGSNKDGEDFETFYAHLKSAEVTKGQEVRQGQVIGIMGSTGLSTGTHLHFEVHINGNRCDPQVYLP